MVQLAHPLQFPHAFLSIAMAQAVSTMGSAQHPDGNSTEGFTPGIAAGPHGRDYWRYGWRPLQGYHRPGHQSDAQGLKFDGTAAGAVFMDQIPATEVNAPQQSPPPQLSLSSFHP